MRQLDGQALRPSGVGSGYIRQGRVRRTHSGPQRQERMQLPVAAKLTGGVRRRDQRSRSIRRVAALHANGCPSTQDDEEAWTQHWRPMPAPGWHDLFALTKRGVASMEGDFRPLLQNLQFFKDLLALPRRLPEGT